MRKGGHTHVDEFTYKVYFSDKRNVNFLLHIRIYYITCNFTHRVNLGT
jgi:hypothetical protein